jgi:peptidoglycan/LPS O-acetylase OafA/YrhL
MTTPTYRPDIDGLRAIAVLGVVIYHSGFDIVSGGYVGVDVFFVISGFLITTIIIREIAEGAFSLANFYERRCRRILPASIVTVAASLIAGYFLLETRDMGNLAHSAIANNLFLSNIFFYLQTGYFDAAAELKPLLHTWSLSLEEQYYVVTPLLLILIARFCQRKYLRIVVPIGIASFAACVYWTTENQPAAFYMLTTRGWELLIGSILAIATIPRVSSKAAMQTLATFGLVLILVSMFLFDDQTVFPGAAAALPTLGTAILIYTGTTDATLVNRALSLRPLVFVGLISYSLYLWHWPIIVYSNYLKGVALTQLESAVLLLAIFGISVLSWRYVETPFRRKQLCAKRKNLFVVSGGATAVLIVASLFATGTVVDIEWRHWRGCENVEERIAENQGLCVVGDAGVEPSFMFWGDSQARALFSATKASAERVGRTGYVASKPGCAPLLGIERVGRTGCFEFNETMRSYIEERPELETVILMAHWTGVAEGTRYNDQDGERFEYYDVLADSDAPRPSSSELVEIGLYRTIRALLDADRDVIIVGPVPEVGHNVPSVNHIALITNRDVNAMIAPTRKEFDVRNEKIMSLLVRIEDDLALPVLRPSDVLCDEARCIVALDNGEPLYHDHHHLSTIGARFISGIFDTPLSRQD